MIFDNIKNIDRYKDLNEVFEILTVIKENRVGEATLSEGLRITPTKIVTESRDVRRFENHELHADIHYCVKGQEKIELTFNVDAMKTDGDNDTERDLQFYENTNDCFYVVLNEGDFLVLYPGEVHKTCCSVSVDKELEKHICKIKL